MKNGYRKHSYAAKAWNNDFEYKNEPAITVSPTKEEKEYAPFDCPRCGNKMVKRGKDKQFYGCVKYFTKFKCQGNRDLDGNTSQSSAFKKLTKAQMLAEQAGSVWKPTVSKSNIVRLHTDIKVSKEEVDEENKKEEWLYDDEGNKIRRIS